MKLFSDRVRTSPCTGAVIPRDRPTSEAARSLETVFGERRVWRAPRGGVASFQVVISTDAPTDGAEIAITAGPFSSSGKTLSEPVVCYEWPCRISEDEWTFEALIPADIYRAAPAEVRSGPLGPRRHHAFWVDVAVPRDAAAGSYQGEVRATGGPAAEVTIEVVPLTLPLCPRVTVDLNGYSESLHRRHHPGLTGPDQIACERSYYREAHDNRAVLHYLPYDHAGNVTEGYAPPLVGRGRNLQVSDWHAYDERFGPLFDGSAMAGSPGGERPIPHWYLPFNFDWPADYAYIGTRGYDQEFAQVLAEFRRHIQDKGWDGTTFDVFFNQKKRYRYFPYDGDERKHAADREVFQHFRSLTDRAAAIAGPAGEKARIAYRTDISWSFGHDALDDQIGPLFDLWVIGFSNFSWSRAGVEAILARGQQAWWYGGGSGPEASTMEADRLAILCWRRGADGFMPMWLCMAVDAALDRADPLSLLYPGRRFGFDRALGSIRLRRIRAATEVTDLLEMLGSAGRDLVDELTQATDGDWWTPTPAWALGPPETMNNDMYAQEHLSNPLAERDIHTPALIRERALDALAARAGEAPPAG